MHPLHVLSQLVLPLELFPTVVTHEVLSLRVSHHVDLQLVPPGEAFITNSAGKSLLCVKCSDMFPDLRILIEPLLAVRAGEGSVLLVSVDVFLQTGNLLKFLSADWTIVESAWVGVGLNVPGQRAVGQEPLAAVGALQRLGLVSAMNRHVLLESGVRGKYLVAKFALVDMSGLSAAGLTGREGGEAVVSSVLHQLQPGVVLTLTAHIRTLELHLLRTLLRLVLPGLGHGVLHRPVLLLLVWVVAEHVDLEDHAGGEPGVARTAYHELSGRVRVVNLLAVPLKIERVGELLAALTGETLLPFVEGEVPQQRGFSLKLPLTNLACEVRSVTFFL